jgi:hypothetical protein
MPGIIRLSDRLLQSTALEAIPFSVQAPITGWNTRDALDAMEDTDAVTLDNWFPDAGGCTMRNGYASWATGLSPNMPVKTLAEYRFNAIAKLIAGCGGSFYDVTATGAVGAALASGFTSDAWQTVAFNQRLFFMNGADTMQIFDGTAMANAAFTGGSTPNLNTIIGGVQYQSRLYFWQANSTGFWYAPLSSIAGALVFYDLSLFCPGGGNLVAVTTFSHDGGAGVQDLICFIMSSGDAIMYQGNDPSNVSTWSMVARYHISPPIAGRAVCNYGAESYLITNDDHIALQAQLVALKLGQLPPRSKIAPSVQAAVAANPTGFGWQVLYYPAGRALIFNIPDPSGIVFTQHVFNTATQAWCRYVNMNAYVWRTFGTKLFFGGANGTVYKADTGSVDNNAAIMADGQQAWTMLPGNTRRRVSAVRPMMQSIGNATYTFYMGFDYQALAVAASGTTQLFGSPWDTSPWNTSPWSSEQPIDPTWKMATGTGQSLSSRLQVSSVLPMKWLRSDFRVEQGQAM